ncbi:MAG TPA: DUF1801 domain-containing protein, partial [Candidatus Acidoferrum sp.]
CVFVLGKDHVTLAFLRGAMLRDPGKLLEGKAKGVRNVKLRSVADVNRPGVKRLILEAVKLNKKNPPSGKMIGMDKRRAHEDKKGRARHRVKSAPLAVSVKSSGVDHN